MVRSLPGNDVIIEKPRKVRKTYSFEPHFKSLPSLRRLEMELFKIMSHPDSFLYGGFKLSAFPASMGAELVNVTYSSYRAYKLWADYILKSKIKKGRCNAMHRLRVHGG